MRDFSGHTALHFAAWKGTSEVIEKLVKEYKMDVNGLSAVGRTPLHYAASLNPDAVRTLVALGAKVISSSLFSLPRH